MFDKINVRTVRCSDYGLSRQGFEIRLEVVVYVSNIDLAMTRVTYPSTKVLFLSLVQI